MKTNHTIAMFSLVVPLSAAIAITYLEIHSMTACDTDKDRRQIVEHIHGLFRAYIAKNRDAIRNGHTHDWRGFQLPSTGIVRGLDAYMETADRILTTMTGTRYEIKDIDVHLYDRIAVVYYVADYWVKENDGENKIPLRSVDIYRHEAQGWNQCGSNICLLPVDPPEAHRSERK